MNVQSKDMLFTKAGLISETAVRIFIGSHNCFPHQYF